MAPRRILLQPVCYQCERHERDQCLQQDGHRKPQYARGIQRWAGRNSRASDGATASLRPRITSGTGHGANAKSTCRKPEPCFVCTGKSRSTASGGHGTPGRLPRTRRSSCQGCWRHLPCSSDVTEAGARIGPGKPLSWKSSRGQSSGEPSCRKSRLIAERVDGGLPSHDFAQQEQYIGPPSECESPADQ
jgi:hypothetical protein